MSRLIPLSLQKLAAARRAYFEDGVEPDGIVDQAIYHSWNRCLAADRREMDMVEFEPIARGQLRDLMDGNESLLRAAATPLDSLAKAVSGAGYAVLMTDAQGYALSVHGSFMHRASPMRKAFRQGVDLSERSIGTSAMACALAERKAVRVFGPEHFFAANHVFHCAAAPIMAPSGTVVGVVDITRDTPQPDLGALSLVSQCAQAIERELFRQVPFFLTINLSWHQTYPNSHPDLMLSFGPDGELLALNENACRFIGLRSKVPGLYFEDIFDGDFGQYVILLGREPQPQPIHLRSGLCLYAMRQEPTGGISMAVDKDTQTPYRATPVRQPEFGEPEINRQMDTALRTMASGLALLIQGETGTGKEVIANALHQQSRGSKGPMIAINCAAIPENLIEGELFGYVGGAYTGARREGAQGKIEMADGGTLFLDEIGDMPHHLQARLLRVLETREVCRLGADKARKVNFQLICATHQDIPQAIRAGLFREDLYYRINGFIMTLPPLRERSRLLSLAQALLDEISAGQRSLSLEISSLLEQHDWRGNVRELKHALTYAHAVAPANVSLDQTHFPATLQLGRQPAPDQGLLKTLEDKAIDEALRQAQGNANQAAKSLGISRATLYRRLQKNKADH
ncbi:MAG: sigma-54-dependent Fis family transcriptional regulator [Rhodocyclaceae bacterium]|nr:MAG: sigma-54-dependent Fis family transcriptional regulator [Rhodocyclaceae bacterium]